jgi:DNA-binding FadR family transcriptional regulator
MRVGQIGNRDAVDPRQNPGKLSPDPGFVLHTRDEGKRVAKKPEAVARLIAQRIADQQFSEDGRIGSETELLATLKISRNVLREAIRMLERYGIVRVQRGIEGGLRAIHPAPVSVIRATSLYLAPSYSQGPASFHRLSLALQLECIEAIIAQPPDKLRQDLDACRQTLDHGPARPTRDEIFSCYEFLGRSCGNPVLDCLMRSVIFQVDFTHAEMSDAELTRMRQMQTHLVQAIASRDAPMARRTAIELRMMGCRFGPITRASTQMLDAG